MKRSDLHREWARVLDMCEGTGVDARHCWKYSGMSVKEFPVLDGRDLHKYEFAVAILEDKPVFIVDKLYGKYAEKFFTVSMEMLDRGEHDYSDNNYWSWNQPKKTFMLNGEELPCADGYGETTSAFLSVDGGSDHKMDFVFSSGENRNKVADAIIKLLKESTGNGE